MIIPETQVRLALVPIERIVVTEHQVRFIERVIHYARLLTHPEHTRDYAGFVYLAPLDAEGQLYTLLDGHHRYLASIIAGRKHVLAIVITEPGQPGYDEDRPGIIEELLCSRFPTASHTPS